jgi:hypothetical protein
MKKLSLILMLIITLTACEGPSGPPGPPGIDGDFIIGTILEIEVDFTAQNGYSFVYEFPADQVEVFESDVVQVYLLEEIIDDSSGPVDVWTPLPNSFFFNDGSQVVYNYNHTFFDVNLFLDGNVALNTLDNSFLNNQVFRIAIIPAEFSEKNPNLNLNSMEAVMNAMPNANKIGLN